MWHLDKHGTLIRYNIAGTYAKGDKRQRLNNGTH